MSSIDPAAGDPQSSARRYGLTAGSLTAVLGAAGVLTYAFFVLASHSLDAESYGALVVLWSAVLIIVQIAFRPIELLLSRTISDHEARGQSIAGTLRIAALIQLTLLVVFLALALVFRSRIEDELLDGRDTLYALMLCSMIAYSAVYFGRGLVAGQHRFGLFALILMLESVGRLLFALVIAVGLADGLDVIALGVLAGPLLSAAVVPYALTHRGPDPAPDTTTPDTLDASDAATTLTLGQGTALAGALLAALLCEQVLLTSGVLFVRAAQGTAAAGFMFNIMLIARAPVLLFQAVAASLLPHLTRLRSSGHETGAEAFDLSVRLTLGVVVGFAAVVIAAVLAIGPQVMDITFGSNFDYGRLDLAYVAVGMGFYLAAGTLNQAVIARGQAREAAVFWILAALAFILWCAVGPLEVFRQVEVGFALGAALLCGGLAVLYRRAHQLGGGGAVASGPSRA